MMPSLKIESRAEYRLAFVPKIRMEQVFTFRNHGLTIEDINNYNYLKEHVGESVDNLRVRNRESIERFKTKTVKTLRDFVILSMFFDQPHYRHDHVFMWDFNAQARVQTPVIVQDKNDELTIQCAKGIADFNVFNFVSTSFQYEDTLKTNNEKKRTSRGNFLDSLSDFFASVGCNTDVLDWAKRQIIHSFDEWKRYSGGFVLPLYDFDLCYNIAKRVRQHRYGQEKSISIDSFLDYLKRTFELISSELKINDEKYMESGFSLIKWSDSVWKKWKDIPSGVHISFKDAFDHCPFIEWINDYSYNVNVTSEDDKQKVKTCGHGSYLSDSFASMFTDMIMQLLFSIEPKGHNEHINEYLYNYVFDNDEDFTLPSHDD